MHAAVPGGIFYGKEELTGQPMAECRLSNVTKAYLERFHTILEDMIKGMTGAELTDSISHDFIVQMIPHHLAAIEMSRNLLQYTTDIALQDIALGIIEEQTKSIEDMRRIECACSMCVNSEQLRRSYECRMEQIMQTMFGRMREACSDNDINANFMREMIPHHKGAIAMSETTLLYDICPELIPVLRAIIVSQQRGVRQMQRLLRCLDC